MTTGQLLFWSGAALLALTGLLAIIFAIKKPKYTPEEAVTAIGAAPTKRLRRGQTVPVSPVTQSPAGTVLLTQEETSSATAPMAEAAGTVLLRQDDTPGATVPMPGMDAAGTVLLTPEEPAAQGGTRPMDP